MDGGEGTAGSTGRTPGAHYPANAGRAPWFLMQAGWTVTWKPVTGGYRLTVTRGPKGSRQQHSASGHDMQRAWDAVRKALTAADGGTTPESARPGQPG